MHGPRLTISAILTAIAAGAAFAQAPASRPSNVVLFVAEHHHRGRSWLLHDFKGEPNKLDGENQVRRHAGGSAASWFRRARSCANAQGAAHRPGRQLQDDPGGSAPETRQRAHRRQQQQSQGCGGGQQRIRPDLSARWRSGHGEASDRCAACARLCQRHLRRTRSSANFRAL